MVSSAAQPRWPPSEGTFSVRQCDISRADEIETAVADAVRERDSLNCLFANAGIAGGAGIYSPAGRLYDLDWSLFQRTLAVNLVGTLATVRAAACAMRPARRGSIVVTVATAGLRADSMVGYGYSASKGALANLVRQLAVDLAADGIRVNGIAPGPLPYEHRRAEPDRPSGGQGLGGYGPAGPDG